MIRLTTLNQRSIYARQHNAIASMRGGYVGTASIIVRFAITHVPIMVGSQAL